MVKYNSLDEVPGHILAKLANYVTNVGGDTFVIHGLPPELTGGTMARYSRASTGLQLTLVREFLDEEGNPSAVRGTEVMDRVLNAFGDESVGELEGVHLGIENVTQLMTKTIEDRRIGGSPIEQSTRYVRYDVKGPDGRWRYLRPKEVAEAGLMQRYEAVMDRAFEVYSRLVGKPRSGTLVDYFRRVFPRDQFRIPLIRDGRKVMVGESGLQTDRERAEFRNGYRFTIRCAALDIGRCVLPSSTLTHLGVFGNGRYLTHLISTLMSSELAEERERAVKIQRELDKVIPTYVKRTRNDPNIALRHQRMRTLVDGLFKGITPTAHDVTLVRRADLIDEVTASALFPYSHLSLAQILDEVGKMPEERKREILIAYRGDRKTRRDRTPRGLEGGYPLTYDLVGGFAEYRDLERHRMLTQQRQQLGVGLGFILPPEVGEVGLEQEVLDLVSQVEDLNGELRRKGLEAASQYVTLFNHRIRWMMGMVPREMQHLGELRTQPAGHPSYRAMTQEMVRQATEREPWLEDMLEFVDHSDPGNKIARAREQSRIAGKNLALGLDGSVDLE